MKSSVIREAFLDYFERKGHQRVPSASLVPGNDPTLLFTNAGMVPFKNVFLGAEQRSYRLAASVQRCLRAGGKHNDLDNVGYTARHHTFFEMLGNFSFGDYFKQEAIEYAWEFLTQVLKLSPQKLWITVYEEDHEAADIWLNKIKVDPKRFSRCGKDSNFWSMGDTGPCGPCSEIFYDHGPDIKGGPPGSPDEDGDRYVEIWNLVFMQFDRSTDGTMTPLAKPCIDTGMGLERISAVMQGRHSNYDIDIFQALIKAAVALSPNKDTTNPSYKVLADHIRATSFLIADGVKPSNEGRGYVLRRIIRRACRHAHQLGCADDMFHQLVPTLVEQMGVAYPELVQTQHHIIHVLSQEEQQFARTLRQGLQILDDEIKSLSKKSGTKEIPGEIVFRLYDTYGFPVDLTADIARERGLTLDMPGFNHHMELQRERARSASSFQSHRETIATQTSSEFIGYDHLQKSSKVLELFKDGQRVDSLAEGESGVVVTHQTPFYPESGGQVGDQGLITSDKMLFVVTDTQSQGDCILHIGQVQQGFLAAESQVHLQVDAKKRQSTALNHSATHLLHSALRHVLGEHVVQQGSLVAPDRLRFDFSCDKPLTTDQLMAVEALVNVHVRANHPVETHLMSLEKAKESGAMCLFGEQYDEEVRVLEMGPFSMELCGGTHVHRTGDIGLFKITHQAAVASGVRRLEAVTGQAAIELAQSQERCLLNLAQTFKVSPDQVLDKIFGQIEINKQLEKSIEQLKRSLGSYVGLELIQSATDIHGVKYICGMVKEIDKDDLRPLVLDLKQRIESVVILLAVPTEGAASLIAGVGRSLQPQLSAQDLLYWVTGQLGGKGGGKTDLAQGSVPSAENLGKILEESHNFVKNKLKIK